MNQDEIEIKKLKNRIKSINDQLDRSKAFCELYKKHAFTACQYLDDAQLFNYSVPKSNDLNELKEFYLKYKYNPKSL